MEGVMSSKIFWIDSETTGLIPNVHAMIQIAGLIDIDGEVVSTYHTNIRPHPGARIDKKALEVNQTKELDLSSFPDHYEVYSRLTSLLESHIGKYDPSDKFILAGYNVGFDEGFLRALFKACGDLYFGSYFAWPKIDVAGLIAEEYCKGLRNVNFKLETMCSHYGIPIKAHNALEDIIATRNLYYKLKNGSSS